MVDNKKIEISNIGTNTTKLWNPAATVVQW